MMSASLRQWWPYFLGAFLALALIAAAELQITITITAFAVAASNVFIYACICIFNSIEIRRKGYGWIGVAKVMKFTRHFGVCTPRLPNYHDMATIPGYNANDFDDVMRLYASMMI